MKIPVVIQQFGNQFRRFIDSHQKFLTAIGAGIVFLTFIVKDGLREEFKDRLSDVVSVKAAYREQEENRNVLSAIKCSGDQECLNGYWPYEVPGPTDTMTQLQVWNILESVVRSNFQPYMDEADEIRINMPNDAYTEGLRTDALERLEVLGTRRSQALTFFEKNGPTDTKRPSTSEQRAAVLRAMTQFNDADKAVFSYLANEVARADSEQTKARHRYETFTVWSYVLFGLGWLVGLIGKIYDSSTKESLLTD